MKALDFQNTELPDVIELRNVSQTYEDGKIVVFNDFNLLIEDIPNQGQMVVLMGESGCGKSTILRYIAGLQKPTSGEVLINGHPVNPKQFCPMIFQKYTSLEHYTVLENIRLPLLFHGVSKEEANERAMEMINIVGLQGHEHKYAKYGSLSGGQLQRVAIARALVLNPAILLMDEPISSLDIYNRFVIQSFIMDLWSKLQCTIILVNHDVSTAVFMGDVIYIMTANPGTIVTKIDVDLPFPRTLETKKSSRFRDLCHEVELKLMEIITSKY